MTVGRVESVGLTTDGVVAHMRLNSGTPVPDNVTATVKSVSAVGEQYIDLVPPDNPASAKLRNGASIDQHRTAIGQDVAGLLNEADNWSTASVTHGCRTCCARRSRPSTDPAPSWPG